MNLKIKHLDIPAHPTSIFQMFLMEDTLLFTLRKTEKTKPFFYNGMVHNTNNKTAEK